MKVSIVLALAFSAASAFLPGPAGAQEPGSGRALAAACFTCHGTHGNSVQNVPPSLAGRSERALYQAMKDFQAERRPATIMHQQARGYTDRQLREIGAYFAAVSPAPAARPAKSKALGR